MLTQSVRRVQPGKRTSGIFAKPADPLDSELWLKQGVTGGRVFTELAKRISAAREQCQGSIETHFFFFLIFKNVLFVATWLMVMVVIYIYIFRYLFFNIFIGV